MSLIDIFKQIIQTTKNRFGNLNIPKDNFLKQIDSVLKKQ